MKKVLVINSSARTFDSQSRKMTGIFIDHWKRVNANPIISFRELGNTDVPHINDKWIAAAFKTEAARSEEETEALKFSNAYIAELRDADVIVLASPMYNWSIPSALKAYIDQILRVNETFNFNRINIRKPYIGLLENKTLVLMLSRGQQGYEKGDLNEHMNFQSTYLTTVFNIIGISDIHVVTTSGKSYDAGKFEKSTDLSYQKIHHLIDVELKC